MATERRVPLLHRTGLHLRAAGRFAQTAGAFRSDVALSAGDRTVNGKSVLEILTLGAGPGIDLVIAADGDDEQAAVEALAKLVEANFNEA